MNSDELDWLKVQLNELSTRIEKLENRQTANSKTIGACLDIATTTTLPEQAARGKLYLVTDISIGTGIGALVYFDGSDWVKVATGDII